MSDNHATRLAKRRAILRQLRACPADAPAEVREQLCTDAGARLGVPPGDVLGALRATFGARLCADLPDCPIAPTRQRQAPRLKVETRAAVEAVVAEVRAAPEGIELRALLRPGLSTHHVIRPHLEAAGCWIESRGKGAGSAAIVHWRGA